MTHKQTDGGSQVGTPNLPSWQCAHFRFHFLSLMGGPTLGLLTDLLDAKIDFISTNKVAKKRPFLLEGGGWKAIWQIPFEQHLFPAGASLTNTPSETSRYLASAKTTSASLSQRTFDEIFLTDITVIQSLTDCKEKLPKLSIKLSAKAVNSIPAVNAVDT